MFRVAKQLFGKPRFCREDPGLGFCLNGNLSFL